MRKVGVAFAVWFALMAGLVQAATVQTPTVQEVASAPASGDSGDIAPAATTPTPADAVPPLPSAVSTPVAAVPTPVPALPSIASAPRPASTPRAGPDIRQWVLRSSVQAWVPPDSPYQTIPAGTTVSGKVDGGWVLLAIWGWAKLSDLDAAAGPMPASSPRDDK